MDRPLWAYGAWELAADLVWNFGVWLALFVLCTFEALILPRGIFGGEPNAPWLLGAAVATGIYALRLKKTARALHRATERSGGLLQLLRASRPRGDDPFWEGAFIGGFSGIPLGYLLGVAALGIAASLGYRPPNHQAFAMNMLLGMWLGGFTWIFLQMRGLHSAPLRWGWLSGCAGIVLVAASAWYLARDPRGGFGLDLFIGHLVVMSCTLAWSVSHLVIAYLSQRSRGSYVTWIPGTGPFGGGWSRRWPDFNPPNGSGGGSGSPAPLFPVLPRRPAGAAEELPILR